MDAAQQADHEHHGDSDQELAHPVPSRILINVFLALIVLTVITVAATQLPKGPWEIWISMGIATIKASLVGAYFMHLRYDNPLHAMLFTFSLFFVALFIGLVLMDVHQYHSEGVMIELGTAATAPAN